MSSDIQVFHTKSCDSRRILPSSTYFAGLHNHFVLYRIDYIYRCLQRWEVIVQILGYCTLLECFFFLLNTHLFCHHPNFFNPK